MSVSDVLEAGVVEHDGGRRVALRVIVTTRGSTPQPAGVMVCVDRAARVTGTLGGGCVEADVRRRAHEMLSSDENALITFVLDDDFGFDDGMICGGQMDIAVCSITPSTDVSAFRDAPASLRAGGGATVSRARRNGLRRG